MGESIRARELYVMGIVPKTGNYCSMVLCWKSFITQGVRNIGVLIIHCGRYTNIKGVLVDTNHLEIKKI